MFRILILFISILLSPISIAAVVLGDPNGKITLIEVFDYQCSVCQRSLPIVEKLIDNNHDLKVRLMPVARLNQMSLYEASAAIAATKYDGKFQEFTNIVLQTPNLTPQRLNNILVMLQLNNENFNHDMHSKFVEEQISEGLQFEEVRKKGVPLFVIYCEDDQSHQKHLSGYQSYEVLQQAVNEAKSHA